MNKVYAPLKISHPAVVLGTWFYIGFSPKAPGTVGSLAAIPLIWGLYYLFWGYFIVPILLAAAVILFLIGVRISDIYVEYTGRQDPPEIVIDEVAAMLLASVFVAGNPVTYPILFLMFRLFDIWKPWPISWADRELKGGLGVMVDDMLAGLLAGIVTLLAMPFLIVFLGYLHNS
jgi:phosphatidylglycerophosphatase A